MTQAVHGARARNRRWLYAGAAVASILAVAVVVGAFCRGAPRVVVLVRHADRQTDADALTAAGVARAQDLARALEALGIRAIYTSEALRTQQTAAPTASAHGLTPMVVPASDVAGLAGRIEEHRAGESVLVVGHSNTVPQIIAELGGPTVAIAHEEYDNLYVLTACRCLWGGGTFSNLRYGAATR